MVHWLWLVFAVGYGARYALIYKDCRDCHDCMTRLASGTCAAFFSIGWPVYPIFNLLEKAKKWLME